MKSLLIIALLAPTLAFANSTKPTPGTVPPTKNVNVNKPVNINAPSNTNSNTSNSSAASVVTNSVNASPTASASSGAAASNQGVSTTVNNNTPDSLKTVGQAPDILTTPTAPCRIAIGVSFGVMGGAAGIGSSVLDEGCNARENARLLWNFGKKEEALKVMCFDEQVAKVLAGCPKKEEPMQQEKVTP